MFKGLGAAIDYAHDRGMVQRDIKPANIMFNRRARSSDRLRCRLHRRCRALHDAGAVSARRHTCHPSKAWAQAGDRRATSTRWGSFCMRS